MATMSSCVKYARVRDNSLIINATLLVPGKYQIAEPDLKKLRYRFTQDNPLKYGDKLDSTNLSNTIEIVDFWPYLDRSNKVRVMSKVVIRDKNGNAESCQLDQSYLIFSIPSLTPQSLPFFDMKFPVNQCR